MASLWQYLLDTIDAQMSVKTGLFITDLRGLMALPMIPFLVAMCFVEIPSTLATVLLAALFLVEMLWVIFLLRRWAAKKRNWTEPTRFSDDHNGY